MGYGLSLKESLATGVERIAREQIGRAQKILQDESLDAATQVHEVRKALKRLRAALRLVRADLGEDGQALSALARDVGRELSVFRDRDVVLATFQKLAGDDEVFRDVRSVLLRRQAAERRSVDGAEDLRFDAACRSVARGLALMTARLQAMKLVVRPKTLARAVKKSHSKNCRAMRVAMKSGDAQDLHEWRKQAKHYGYTSRLLGKVWPSLGGPSLKRLEALGDCLGEERDLGLLGAALAEAPPTVRESKAALALLALVHEEQRRLVAEAFALGQKVVKGEPRAVKKHMVQAWPSGGVNEPKRAGAVGRPHRSREMARRTGGKVVGSGVDSRF